MRKLAPITDSEWAEVDEFNRFIWDDFLTNSTELSPHSRKAYSSNLRIWFVWVKDNLNNKRQTDITSLEFKRFQNWMVNRGCSSSDIYSKRAAISSLNQYIEIYYQNEYPQFRNFINRSIKRPPKVAVHEKEPLTKEELDNLISTLRERGDLCKLSYILFSYETGCRRAESAQIMKDIVDAKPIVKQVVITDEDGNEQTVESIKYMTPPLRCKGAGAAGKRRSLVFGQETMDAFKEWLEQRGEDDCPAMFITKYGGIRAASPETFNSWAQSTFSKIVGRRVTPHDLRRTRATIAITEEGKDIRSVQKLLGHESSETTEIYIVRNNEDDLDELFI